MLSLFLNPWTLAAGAFLVSSPIIIHLINRMRFQRVRWAAMEFLLKSQKRNRRRLILEQLLLLFLRCLLVFLAGLLLARFLGFNLTTNPQETIHVVLLDDTPSMGDFWRESGETKDAFKVGRAAVVEDIARSALQATTPQSMVVLPLTELDAARGFDRVNNESVEALEQYLNRLDVSALHVGLLPGLQRTKATLDQNGTKRRLLHVVSDFRSADWAGGEAEAVTKLFEDLQKAGVQVHLLDAAHPTRSESGAAAVYHDNLGIVDFQPETPVVARYAPVEFAVTVANFSNSEQKNVRVTVRVNGVERAEGSFNIASLPANERRTETFTVAFDRVASDKAPLERFSLVSVELPDEPAGLKADNKRFATVEVRDRVPMLVVEGDLSKRGTKEAESFYLQRFFSDTARGYDFVLRGVGELERPDLEQYPTIWMLNVPRLSDKAVRNLEAYVRNGGGLAVFLGPDTPQSAGAKPEFYNRLHADGTGLFPVPVNDRPTDLNAGLTEDQRLERRFNPNYKAFPRNYGHPLFARIYTNTKNREEYDLFLRFLTVDQYYGVDRLRWKPGAGVEELMTLPNYRSMADYTDEAQRLARALPADAKGNEKYAAALKAHQRAVIDTLAVGGELSRLAAVIDALLRDAGDPKDPEKPNLQEFWQREEQQTLRNQFRGLLDAVRYGDPLLVVKQFGRGKVAAFLSTAGTAWNNFADGTASPYYVPLMLELQKYLAGTGVDRNLPVGAAVAVQRDALRFTPKARLAGFFEAAPSREQPNAEARSSTVDLGELAAATVRDNRLTFDFDRARKPGVYAFEFTPLQAEGADKARAEYQAFAFNIDTAAEGNLARVAGDELAKQAPGGKLHAPGGDWKELLKEKRSDLSESPWMYLLILCVLVAEQALAVRLSYHTAGGDAPAPARRGMLTTA